MSNQGHRPEMITDLVQFIHEGPFEKKPMMGFVKALRRYLNASCVGLTLQQPVVTRPLVLFTLDGQFDNDDFMNLYLSRFAEDDPFPYDRLVPNVIYTAAEMLGEHWREDAYYRRFLQPFGFHDVMVVRIEIAGSLNAYLFVARSESMPSLSGKDAAVLEKILPDLSRALKVSSVIRRLEAEQKIYEQAVEAMGMGTIILDGLGRVIYANLLAHMLLSSQDTLILRDDRLTCKQPRNREQLQDHIDRALSDRTGGFSHALPFSSGGEELLLLIRAVSYPLSVSNEPGPRVVIFVSNRSRQPRLPVEIISELFGLSPAESDLAIKLSEGASLAEAAMMLDITEHTARTYSKRIYSKTGTNRQAELVQLILSSVARVGSRTNDPP